MASAKARRTAITMATTQVRSGNGFVRRATASGGLQPKPAAKPPKKA